MKIVVVSHAYPRRKNDWSANFIEDLCLSYIKLGHEVILFIPATPRWTRKDDDLGGVRVVRFNYCPVHKWQVFGYGSAMTNDLKPSISHVLLLPLLIISGIFCLLRFLKKERSVDLIHSHWAVPNSIIAVIARYFSKTKAKIFTSFPGSDVTALTMMGLAGRLVARKIIGKSDYLFCNSHDLKDALIHLGIPYNKLDLVIYGVDPQKVKFDPLSRDKVRATLGIRENERMLMMAGRFVPKKGFGTALRAIKEISGKFQRIKMIIVGDGNLITEYQEILMNDATNQYVMFVGSLPLEDLYATYSACDIFIMPNRKLPADGLNVTVVEAMSCACPVVATNIGGNELVVSEGVNGFLVDADNPHLLAEKVLALLADDSLAQKFGQNSRKLVEEKYNWNVIARHYIDVYWTIKK